MPRLRASWSAGVTEGRQVAGSNGDNQPRAVKSAQRTLEILEHLAGIGERRTLGELARDLDVPKSSLHALLRTMEQMGWVQTDPASARVGLGVRALLVGASYVDADDVVALTSSVLDELAEELGETVHLGRLDGADIVYLAKRESNHPLRLFSAIGRRLPAHTTALGKAILSMQEPEAVRAALPDELIALTPNTIVEHDQLMTELELTRQRGYAIDNEENTLGIRCIAVPLRRNGHIQDAISCSTPTLRLTPDGERNVIEAMQHAREQAESRLRLGSRAS